MLNWLKQMFTGPQGSPQVEPQIQPESQYVVTFDDNEVRCRRPSGEMESVTWDDLEVVIIQTTDTGPFAADVWWLLVGADESSGCAIPQGATGDDALLKRLQLLPGFDNKQAIAAMSCADNQKFVCWRRPAA